MRKRSVTLILAVIVCMALLSACGGGGSISGKWEWGSVEHNDNTYRDTFEFTREAFTLTTYKLTGSWEPPQARAGEPPIMPYRNPYVDTQRYHGGIESLFIRNVSIEWELISSIVRDDGQYSGWTEELYRFSISGTYSITDGRIEFIFPGNNVVVRNIETTENTIRFSDNQGNSARFTRSGRN